MSIIRIGLATAAALAALGTGTVAAQAATPHAVTPKALSCGNQTWTYGDSSASLRCNGPASTQFRAWVTCQKNGATKFYGVWVHEAPAGNQSGLSTASCPGANNFVTGHGFQLQ